MKNALFATNGLLELLLRVSPNSDPHQTLQAVLPSGSRAKLKPVASMQELGRLAYQLMEDKYGVGVTMTITQLDYKVVEHKTVATIYYRTSTGYNDQVDLYARKRNLTDL